MLTPGGKPELDRVTVWEPPAIVSTTKSGSPATTLAEELVGEMATIATKFAVTTPAPLTVAEVEELVDDTTPMEVVEDQEENE